jgi:hypothetical protein
MGQCAGEVINRTVVGIEFGWVAGLSIGRNKKEDEDGYLQDNETHCVIVMVVNLKYSDDQYKEIQTIWY